MFRLGILLTLLTHPFSFDRANLRFFSLKRLLVIMIVYPAFVLNFIVNWFFLLLDEVIFPGYRKTDTQKILFIIGVPRSATTFIFHKLLEDEKHFQACKLWEILLAPSVIQKYLYLGIGKLLSLLGVPLRSLMQWLDAKIFTGNRLRNIHKTGLFVYEEDESLFLMNLSSTFFYFFYPQTRKLEKLIYHDRDLPQNVKDANFRFYKKMIQRHNYVFDRDNKRYYISKNPSFTPKIGTVYRHFPDAKYLNPLRSPLEAIPSTISLMAANYSKFCRMPERYPLQEGTRDLLIDWYLYAHKIMREKVKENGMTILYPEIRKDPEGVIQSIYEFLVIEKEIQRDRAVKRVTKEVVIQRSKHKYDSNLGIDHTLIRTKLHKVFPEEIQI